MPARGLTNGVTTPGRVQRGSPRRDKTYTGDDCSSPDAVSGIASLGFGLGSVAETVADGPCTCAEVLLFSAGESVRSNWEGLEWSRKGWPASRHPATVSEMIFTEADAIWVRVV
jgi:hypothetical protein